MKGYLAYTRVSTTRQGEEGSSLVEQRASIEAYATRHNISIAQWFEEMETAAKRGRPQFAKLTNLLRTGKAEGLILHKIDRGARNLKDWSDLGELLDAGVDVRFAHDGLDMKTRGGRLAADIQAVVAADYIRNLRDEVKKGFYGRLKQGFYPLPAPRGYLDHGKAKAKTLDPVTSPLVKYAFTRYASSSVSLEDLRHELAARGLTSAGGSALSLDAISSLLHNPFYIGLIRIQRTGELFEGLHEPLIDKTTFDRVQAVMRGRTYPKGCKHDYLFRRLIKCGACGRSLTAETQRGHVYYRCHDRGCHGVSFTEPSIDEFISEELEKLSFDAEDLRDLRDQVDAFVQAERGEALRTSKSIERDLALIEQKLQRLTDTLLDGTIPSEIYNERRTVLLHQKATLNERRANGLKSTFWEDVSKLFEQGNTAQQSYLAATRDEKREAVKIFGSNITVAEKSLCFSMHFVFDEVRKSRFSDIGGPRPGASRKVSIRHRGAKRLKDMLHRIDQHRDHHHGWPGECLR